MLYRYFTLPKEPFPMYDPATDLPVKDKDGKVIELTHMSIFRTVISDPRLKTELDLHEIYDLRKKLTAPFGTIVELTEEEHKALMGVVRRPANAQTTGVTTFLTEGALVSPGLIDLFKSIINATSDKPKLEEKGKPLPKEKAA